MRVPGCHAMDVGALGDIPGPDAERRVTTRQRRSSRSPDAPSTSGATAALRTQTGHVTTSGRDGHRRTGSSKKGMFHMNFKDKRTRRICAASASAAVIVAGGVTVGSSFANASGALALTTGNAFTTLDLATGTASQQTLQASVAMTAGTDAVTLTYGGNSTAGLTAASNASAIQTALNALASVTAAGGVTVTHAGAGADLTTTTAQFIITFNNGGARTAITVTPATGTVAVNSSTGGNTLGSTAGIVPQTVANAVF